MAGCCDPRGCDEFFTERVARRDADRYRRSGLDDNAQRLVELVLREGGPGEIYNIGGEDHENLEVTHRILELTGAGPTLIRHVEDRAGHDRRYALDDGKLRALGWVPRHSFGEGGLRETVDWYAANRAWWQPIKTGEYRRYYEEQYAERLRA